MGYNKIFTNDTITEVLSKGVQTMPDNPSAYGYTKDQIKEFYYLPEEEILGIIAKIDLYLSESLSTDTKEVIKNFLTGNTEQLTDEEKQNATQLLGALKQVAEIRKIYGTSNDGGQTTYGLDNPNEANANNIPTRGENGAIMITDNSCKDNGSGEIKDGLQAVNKNFVKTKISQVESYVDDLFKGALKGVVFSNYREMCLSINQENDKEYNVGQNIYVDTLNVPDLWVRAIIPESKRYTYSSDEDIVEKLQSQGYIEVGYYLLGQLETQKVALEEYQKKTDNGLKTTSKEIVGAINELNDKAGQGSGSGIRTLETTPTTTTEGYLGEIVQVSDGTAYQCTAITDGAYEWKKVITTKNVAGQGTSYNGGRGSLGLVGLQHIYNSGLKVGNDGNLFVWSPPNANSDNVVTGKYPNVPVSFLNIARAVQYALSNADTFTSYKPEWTDTTRQKARQTLGIKDIYTHDLRITFNDYSGQEIILCFQCQTNTATEFTIENLRNRAFIGKEGKGQENMPIWFIGLYFDANNKDILFWFVGADMQVHLTRLDYTTTNYTLLDTVY